MTHTQHNMNRLKTIYFLCYPIITLIIIPYIVQVLWGDNTVYRTEMTLYQVILVCLINGPLFLLLFKALPNDVIWIFVHFIIIAIIIFILPTFFINIYFNIVDKYQMIFTIVGVDVFMVWDHKRKIKYMNETKS